jgi:hypothetical protein
MNSRDNQPAEYLHHLAIGNPHRLAINRLYDLAIKKFDLAASIHTLAHPTSTEVPSAEAE